MIRGGFWGGAWGLSWGGAWGEAWFLLNQPYQELSLKGQIFVRSYLTRIHSVEVAEQIVSVAAVNNISVIDAEVVVTAKHTTPLLQATSKLLPTQLVALQDELFTASSDASDAINAVDSVASVVATSRVFGGHVVTKSDVVFAITTKA